MPDDAAGGKQLDDLDLEELRDLVARMRRDRWAGRTILYGGQPAVPSFEALPPADGFHGFGLVGIRGDGATVADKVYVCLRDATGTYGWVQVA